MKNVRKENSLGQSETATWYSSLLFTVNGNPLKFYLKGYNRTEFCGIRKIIEAYGGQLSEPDEDTIIFTEQDHSTGINQCYHVKYLQDCIVANKLLDLKEYKLPLATNHEKVKEESTSHEETEGKTNRKPESDGHESRELAESSTQSDSRCRGFYSEDEDRKIIDYLIKKNLISRTGSMYTWTQLAADNIVNRTPFSLLDHFKRKLIFEYEKYTSSVAAREEFKELLKKRGKSTAIRYQPSHRPHRCIKWSDEENRILLNYIIEHNLIHRMRGRYASCEIIEKAGLKNKRSVYSVQSQIFKLFNWGYEKYITDPEALRKIAAIHRN